MIQRRRTAKVQTLVHNIVQRFSTRATNKRKSLKNIAQINAAKLYDHDIVTQIGPHTSFYQAEDYHQDYLAKHPDNAYIRHNDLPKLERLKHSYPELYR